VQVQEVEGTRRPLVRKVKIRAQRRGKASWVSWEREGFGKKGRPMDRVPLLVGAWKSSIISKRPCLVGGNRSYVGAQYLHGVGGKCQRPFERSGDIGLRKSLHAMMGRAKLREHPAKSSSIPIEGERLSWETVVGNFVFDGAVLRSKKTRL